VNELTEFTGPSEGLGRIYGAQGPMGGLVRTMATDLFPIVQAGWAAMDPELHYLAGSKLCCGSIFDGAPGVGVNAQVGLQNPANSGVIIVVDAVTVFNLSDDFQYDLRITPDGVSAGPDATSRGALRDSRWGSSSVVSTGVLYSLSSAATVGALLARLIFGGPGTQAFPCGPIVLAPPSQLTVYNVQEDENLNVIFQWRERRIGTWEARSG
jgi:hypothetical protein